MRWQGEGVQNMFYEILKDSIKYLAELVPAWSLTPIF